MAFTDLTDSIRGWSRSVTAEGIRLASAIGDEGSIEIRQRVPLRPIREMIAEHSRTVWGAKAAPELGPAMLFHTCEGEYACELPVKVKGPNGQEGHWMGVVVGDDYAVLIDGIAAMEHWVAMKDRVGMIAWNYYLALGEIRQRKFEYQLPAGWNALRRATSTWWYHPEYPRQMAIIKVFDARPAVVNAPDILDRMLFVDPSIIPDGPPVPPVPCQNAHGLVGNIIRGNGMLAGVPVTFAAAYLTDDRFAYHTRLEAHRDIFPEVAKVGAALVDSIHALPPNTLKSSGTNLIHWVE